MQIHEPEDANGHSTNGCFSSSAAVGRSSGFTLRHLAMKSRASSDNMSGIFGSSPLPIANKALTCSFAQNLTSTLILLGKTHEEINNNLKYENV